MKNPPGKLHVLPAQPRCCWRRLLTTPPAPASKTINQRKRIRGPPWAGHPSGQLTPARRQTGPQQEERLMQRDNGKLTSTDRKL